MTKKVAICQSNYIPWKGYFDLMNQVDEFLLFDDMQYTKRDWRNRNRIKTPNEAMWLTIPVKVKGKYYQKIYETVISYPNWNIQHWKTIVTNYSKARFFHEYKEIFEDLYLGCQEKYLSKINYRFINAINELLDIDTKLSWSMEFTIVEGKTERLVELCKQLDASTYISGPSAKNYIDNGLFLSEGIELEFLEYANYPAYNQLFLPFEHNVSIIDLIFNEGDNAKTFLKSFEDKKE